ncbi:MAG: sterol desaturase family protein [Flavobacteriales bacterium]|nr:sterol desaturase family protein [Flavobacteriales bacterium]
MNEIWSVFADSFSGYWNYLLTEILNPSWENYFYYLIVISILVWVLELIVPWRTNQSAIRKDFWQDAFYMFFNFFIFNLIIYVALSNVAEFLFLKMAQTFGIKSLQIFDLSSFPKFVQLLFFFLISDFVQWSVHRALHRFEFLWRFHKIHHSVQEMGFAAHLRFHWAETVFYKSALYIPIAIIGGFSVKDVFIVHYTAIAIGHLNHANVNINYGPLKYILNNPRMHIWHHVKSLPEKRRFGVNFGISLSLWDYLFKTAYIPHSGRDIELGFDEIEVFPESFSGQMIHPFRSQKP